MKKIKRSKLIEQLAKMKIGESVQIGNKDYTEQVVRNTVLRLKKTGCNYIVNRKITEVIVTRLK